MSEDKGGTPDEDPNCKPVLNDREADEAAKRSVRDDTGGAIDADAAHERSS
jgi:hypothetical protein